ncbi:MAG: ABC transporter substrate-binding protein, partial [Promethearchaeota archaeon]
TMRKAASYAFDYDYVIEEIFDDQAVRLKGPIPAPVPFANTSKNYPVYNLSYARQILVDAGVVPLGAPINNNPADSYWQSLTIATWNYTWNVETAERGDIANKFKDDMAAIGIKVDVYGVSWGEFIVRQILYPEQLMAYSMGWLQDYNDPENYLYAFFSNESVINGMRYYEPDVEALIRQGATESDQAVRAVIYDQIQELMIERDYPALWLISGKNNDAWVNELKGWVPNSIGFLNFYPCYKEYDTTNPIITIYQPIANSEFGETAPAYNISVSDPNLDTVWYTMDGGINNKTISSFVDILDQDLWDALSDGPITITFYANDTLSHVNSSSVLVVKDVNYPIITIYQPIANSEFGETAPVYNISVSDPNLDAVWYTMDGGINNKTISSFTDILDQGLWDALPEGPITITFYANDTLGHVNSNSVLVVKDVNYPIITIYQPIANSEFGETAPAYNISVSDPNLDTVWYTMDGGINNKTISSFVDILDQGLWDALPDGPITITFYANDTLGHFNSNSVLVVKDVNYPIITIYQPTANSEFGETAPAYHISVSDPNLDTVWYTMDGGINNITITSFWGNLDQGLWDALPEGPITITFYANDTLGHVNSNSVIIIKNIPSGPGGVPSFNIFIIFGIIGLVTAVSLKKKFKKF